MYRFTFVLDNGHRDIVIGNVFSKVLCSYFDWQGADENNLVQIIVQNNPPTQKGYKISDELIKSIVDLYKRQNDPCIQMNQDCGTDYDPITLEEWCSDVPHAEYVRKSGELHNCYRLSTLIQSFTSGLEATKNDLPMPQWPREPATATVLSPALLNELYAQARKAKIPVPIIFEKFINAMNKGVFDNAVAMQGQYIGLTDKINPEYMSKFVEPMVSIMVSSPDANLDAAMQMMQTIT